MNKPIIRFAEMTKLGTVALLLWGSLGIGSAARAEFADSGFDQSGMSDGAGVGIDLSVSGEVGDSNSLLAPTPDSPSEPAHPQQANPANPIAQDSAPPAAQLEVRLFGDSDRSLGVEILNRLGQGQQRIRIGIPFL
ncbi:hypothetical protein [Leptolyngbya sp. ST-U4]|uniref:hypothetical protein n=1 Tax=Leptolyngbya sp. ST-U4 TaxID=2933912 RepID=UPI0032993D79